MISADRREEGRRSRWPSLRPLRLAVAGGVSVGAMNLLGAAPAWAHDDHSGAFTSWDAAVVRSLVLVSTALVGGVALLRPLTGPVNIATRWMIGVAACSAVAGILELSSAGRASWWLAIVQALVTLVVASTLGRPVIATVGGLVLTAALAVEAVAGSGWTDTVAGGGWVDTAAGGGWVDTAAGGGWIAVAVAVAHTGAAAVWVAAAAVVAVADPGTRRALLRRLTPVAVCAGVLVAATGLVRARLLGLRVDSATAESPFARVVALKAALLVGVTVLGLLGYRRLVRGRDTGDRAGAASPAVAILRLSAIGLAGALVAGAALAAIDVPPAAPVPGVPLLRSVVTGATHVPVVVVPQRPGWNLVHVGAEASTVGMDRNRLVPATVRPGAAGGWALVHLPAGQSRLWIGHSGRLGSLRIDAGRASAPADGTTGPGSITGPGTITGPDGPECMSAVLGGLAAGRDMMPNVCPADRLTDPDAASLKALVTYLVGRGVPAVTILDDPSARSRAASQVVRAAAVRHRLTVTSVPQADSAVVVVSGWSGADATLRGVTRGEVPGLGTYLAPWLANARLLAYGSGAVVALRYDPRDLQPLRYASALRGRFAGETATAAGYEAWRTATDAAVTGATARTHLYAAATISLLPAEFAHDHGVRGGWLPGGTITRVTPALED